MKRISRTLLTLVALLPPLVARADIPNSWEPPDNYEGELLELGVAVLMVDGGRMSEIDGIDMNTNLVAVVRMLAERGILRQHEFGTMRFSSNDNTVQSMHVGGTAMIKPPSPNDGAARNLQEYEWGFKIKKRNLRQVAKEEIEIDTEFEFNGLPTSVWTNDALEIKQQQASVHTTLRCPFDRTVVVSKCKHLQKAKKDFDNVLRRIALRQNHVLGLRPESHEDERLLVLASIRRISENDDPMFPKPPLRCITLP